MRSTTMVLDRISSLERKLQTMVNNPEVNSPKDAEKIQIQLAELYWVLSQELREDDAVGKNRE